MSRRYQALVIGGSAGSLPVLVRVLGALPANSELAVVVCVHTSANDVDDICRVLARGCALPVVEASERRPLRGGRIYVAAGGYHLLVERSRHFAICVSERVHYARPSIDVLFKTMAEAYRRRLIGMLLSGANADGAAGLHYIHARGGMTLVQEPNSASAPEMPAGAVALFTPDRQNTPEQLSTAVSELADAVC